MLPSNYFKDLNVHISMPHTLYLLCMSESQHLIFYDIIKEGKISKGKSTKQNSIPFHDRDRMTNF